MRASEEQVMVGLLRLAAQGAALERIDMPAEAMTITRAGKTYTLRFLCRVNSAWCWAEDQFGDRWRVAA
jgi:hypothetical protein